MIETHYIVKCNVIIGIVICCYCFTLFYSPFQGLISDLYGHQRGAYIFTACLSVFGSFLTCIIGFREVCCHYKSYDIEEIELICSQCIDREAKEIQLTSVHQIEQTEEI